MAMISCSECGNQVSDKAPACVHCGVPISGAKVVQLMPSVESQASNPMACVILDSRGNEIGRGRYGQTITIKVDGPTVVKAKWAGTRSKEFTIRPMENYRIESGWSGLNMIFTKVDRLV